MYVQCTCTCAHTCTCIYTVHVQCTYTTYTCTFTPLRVTHTGFQPAISIPNKTPTPPHIQP